MMWWIGGRPIKYSKHKAACTLRQTVNFSYWYASSNSQLSGNRFGKVFASSHLPKPPFKAPRVRFLATALMIRQNEGEFLLKERRTIGHLWS